jgi:hypothetical protein
VSLIATGYHGRRDRLGQKSRKRRPFPLLYIRRTSDGGGGRPPDSAHIIMRRQIYFTMSGFIESGVDRGQIEGGSSGAGLVHDGGGHSGTNGPVADALAGHVKIPTTGDVPRDFRLTILDVHPIRVLSKQQGRREPPFMLALSAWLAIKTRCPPLRTTSWNRAFSPTARSHHSCSGGAPS